MKKYIFILLFFCINLLGSERIITLTPSINEIVFALGQGKNVVANTLFSNYPKESKDLPKVGGYATMSLEKILNFKPTVVIAQDYNQKLISDLKALGVKTLVFKTNTLDDIKHTIKTLGEYFKVEEKANEFLSQIDNELKQLSNIINDKKILLVIGPRKDLNNQIYITGNNLYFEDVIKASGNRNAYFSTSTNQPVVNKEKIINMNPDIIILLSPRIKDNLEEQKRLEESWKTLPVNASINKNVYLIAKDYAGIPSDRVIYFIKDFKKILINVRNKQLQ